MAKRIKTITVKNKPPNRAAKSTKNSWTSPARIELEKRKAEALNYRSQGAKYADIAETMGISLSTAHRYVVEALDDIPKEAREDCLRLVLARLDEYLSAHHANAANGDPAATQMALQVLDRQAKLLGLYPDQGRGPKGVGVIIDDPMNPAKPRVSVAVSFVDPPDYPEEPAP